MSDFKDLIRFKPVEAVEKARTKFATLIEKYKKEDIVTADELLADAIEYKWATKAVRGSIVGEDVVCN